MKLPAIFLALLVLPTGLEAAQPAAPPATKQTGAVLGQHDNNAPIDISSDSFQADLNGKSGTWTGNVIVIQGDMKLRANTVHMTTVNGKADKVMANGNVVVDSPRSGTATGDNGVYSVAPRTVVLTGNVVLKKGKDVMQGTQLTVNLATGQAVLGGGVKGQTQSSSRVRAVFTPNSQ
ncbi:MAG TPA: lipopolysaccharide transport periplasmic protein LptA [Rhizomicrobium sp.]|nr:lipopolysaccharide transport periplasmic protein LptA [Rhizomicrobium sp.]